MRVFWVAVTTVIGIFLGLGSATLFGLAGLIWTDEGLGPAPYWEAAESESGVFVGSALLLGWLGSLAVTFFTVRSGPKIVGNVKMKPLGIALAVLSILLTVTALVLVIVVFPAQYTWMYY